MGKLLKLKSGKETEERVGGGREIRGNVPWSRTHPFFQEKGMGTVEFGCCDASAHPWKLDLSVGSIGGGRKKFNYTRMLRVVCR
jgi:hypothetical protein